MNARIVQIGKRRWLAGMTWSSYEDVPNKEELGEDAARLHASWVAVRAGEAAVQGGFCAPVAGVKGPNKLFSLAAMLADSREQPWLGIFKIEEGLWWYVAVRDGHAILPDGDVIGGEQDIYDARERHAGFTDWNYIEGDAQLLAEFIDEIDARPTRVRALDAGKAKPAVILGIAAAALIGAGGTWSWLQNQEAEKRAGADAFARARAALLSAQPPAPVQAPVAAGPVPNDWVAACRQVLAPVPLSQYGWVLKQVACAGQQASVLWIADEGATVAAMPEGTVIDDGKAVLQSLALPGIATHPVDNAVELGAARHALRAWAQQSGFALAFTEQAAPAALPGAPPAPKPAGAPSTAVVLETQVSPFRLDFSALPGLRLTKMNTTESGWHIEGILYGR